MGHGAWDRIYRKALKDRNSNKAHKERGGIHHDELVDRPFLSRESKVQLKLEKGIVAKLYGSLKVSSSLPIMILLTHSTPCMKV